MEIKWENIWRAGVALMLAAILVIAVAVMVQYDVPVVQGSTYFGDLNSSGALYVGSTSDLRGNVSDGAGAFTVADNMLIDGAADAEQLVIQGFSTQTNPIIVVETSAGVNKFTADNSGNIVVAGTSDLQGNVSDSGGTLTIADNAYVTGTARIDGATDIRGIISNGGGDVVINDTFVLTGTSDFNGAMNVDANGDFDSLSALSIDSDKFWDSTGNLKLDDNVDVTGTLDVQGGDITLQNDETISNGTNGVVEITTDLFIAGTTNTANSTVGTLFGDTNALNAKWAGILSGYSNIITGTDIANDARYSVIVGGNDNEITTTGDEVVIVGGYNNIASGAIDYCFVGGGYHNEISGTTNSSVLVGGAENIIESGNWSSILGGYSNHITADYAVAFGRRAHATHPGTFVWADSTDADFTDVTTDTFNVRAAGGTYIVGDLDVSTAGVVFGVDGLYALGYAAGNARALLCGQASITGTATVASGADTFEYVMCSLGEAPELGDAAFTAWCTISGGDALLYAYTVTATQTTETNVLVNYCVVSDTEP